MFSKVQADVDILIFSYIRNALGPYKIHYDCISMHFLSKFTLVQKIVLCCASIGVCFFEDHFYFHRSIPHKFPSFTLPIQLDYERNVKWRNIDRTEECFILFSPFTNFRLLKNTEKCFWSEPSTSGVKATHKNDTICWNTSISGYKNIDQSIPINCEWSRKMAMNTSLTKSSQHFFWLNVSSHWFPSSFFGLCWVISQRHIFIGKSFWTWIC